MLLQVMSDLHLECHPDKGVAWIERLDPTQVDVLILAGDIAEFRGGLLERALRLFCSRYPEVIFVPGNHEYYGSELEDCERGFAELDDAIFNLHILNGSEVNLHGQRFIGATLWFKDREGEDADFWRLRLNDYRQIKGGFASWVSSRAERDFSYLSREVQAGDVVITHHIPSRRGVAPRWRSSIDDFGRFFVHELPEEVVQKSKVWCHGHGHDSVQTELEGHRLISNPFGYWKIEENQEFNARLLIQI